MDQKMMDRIRELEKRRAAGERVPELDALYEQVDRREQRGYESVKPPVRPASAAKPMAKGGYVKAADGCAKRGKTKGRMV
jgi:hypothetical protein